MNRIIKSFKGKKKLLSIYFTAGFPNVDDTVDIIHNLQSSGVDMVEIGLPFSDPLADGPTIQKSSATALNNGMTTSYLFNQLIKIRDRIEIPLIIMGYFNPILQFGVEEFCRKCNEVGIDGLIIPDLPAEIFKEKYSALFEKYQILNMFLITPQTSEKRIKFIDKVSKGFIYMVSSAATTGAQNEFSNLQEEYFKRISKLNLNNKLMVGFGISNSKTYKSAISFSDGAIIGSAFIKYIEDNGIDSIKNFIKKITN